MRGLTILVGGGADAADLATALTLALAQRAFDAPARLHLDGPAVALVAAASALLDEALAAGVAVSLCQTGLAAAGMAAAALDARLGYGGMVGLLAGLGDDRLVAF